MKASELRQSILQAAVQGKLVPQDLHDEPASELLARIRAEKAKLIKEGKIKKETKLPPIKEDEIPYDLPEGWVWCRLNDIAILFNGRAYKKHELLEDGGTPVLRVGNLFTSNKWYYSKLNLPEEKYCDNGDLLYAWSASFGPHIWNGGRVTYHYHIWKILLPIPMIRDYMYYTLLEQTQEIKNSGHGLAMIHVTKENTEKGLFPLPPLAEQQRIVAKVDELMALCDDLEAAEKELETLETHFIECLPKSILQMAVQGKLVPHDLHDEPATKLLERIRVEKARLVKEGKLKKEKPLPPITEDEIPYDLPEEWIWCRLGEVIQLLSGRDLETKQFNDKSIGIPYITGASAIAENQILITRWTDEPVVISKAGDLLISCKGTVGKTIFNKIGDCHIARQIMALRFPYTGISSCYIDIFIKSYVHQLIIQAKSIIPGISRDDILLAPMPLPPLAEQQRIVVKTNELIAMCNELKTAKAMPKKL